MTSSKTSPYIIDPIAAGLAREETESTPTPQLIVEPVLAISVSGTPRLANGTPQGQTVVTHSLALPMPSPEQPQFNLASMFERPTRRMADPDAEPDRKACLVSMQVEEFLLGLGLKLPSRRLASWALRTIKRLEETIRSDRAMYESRIAGIERNSSDNITRARHERDQFAEGVRGWKQYAEALEARIERSGGRLSKKNLELRPTPRVVAD